MKKILLAMLIIFSASINLFSQKVDYDLNDYQAPNLYQHTLKFKINSNLSQSNVSRERTIEEDTEETQALNESTDLMSRIYLNFNYRLEMKLKKRYHYLNIRPSLSYRTTSYSEENEVEDTLLEKENMESDLLNYTIYFNFDSINRFYLANSSLFFESNLYTNSSLSKCDETIEINSEKEYEEDDDYDINSNSHNYLIDTEFALGFGRVEDINYLRSAIYLLQDLQDNKLLKREPTNKEIKELADLMITINNETFFDIRLKRKYEIEQLNNFFINKNLIIDFNSTYIAVLFDNFYYNKSNNVYFRNRGIFRTSRECGQMFKAGGGYIFNKHYYKKNELGFKKIYKGPLSIENLKRDYLTDSKRLTPYVFLAYEKHLSYGINVQTNYHSILSYSKLDYENNVEYEESVNDSIYESYDKINYAKRNQLLLESAYLFSWYPTNRTDIILSAHGYYYQIEGDIENNVENTWEEYEEKTLGLKLQANTYYYFSPQLRINARISYNLSAEYCDSWEKNKYSDFKNNRSGANFSVGVTYFLF
ncbi:MAG: hypothetical protein KAS49_03860 [Candidatus Cloacimonetes bacterium]|nr:hypothetical protein [Candidatus Cloacimonadota bacterium]